MGGANLTSQGRYFGFWRCPLTAKSINIVVMLCYCCVVYLVGHLYSKRYIELFFMSRRNTTFLSKVGEMGVGETGVGEQGISLDHDHKRFYR